MPENNKIRNQKIVIDTFKRFSTTVNRYFHLDTNILFVLKENYLVIGSWNGENPGDFRIEMNNSFLDMLSSNNQSVFSVCPEDCSNELVRLITSKINVYSGLAVPLLSTSDVLGLWLIGSRSKHTFDEKDKLLFQMLAENFNLAIQKQLISDENQRYADESDAITEISTEISQLMDIDRVLELIVEKVCHLLKAEISYIALANDEEQEIRVRVTHGTYGDALNKLVHKYGEGVGGRVAITGVPVLVDNYPEGAWPKPSGIPDLIATENIVSAICVPMRTRRGLIGVLYAASRQKAFFNHSHLDLLQAIGIQAAIAIENARLFEEQKISTEKLQAILSTHKRLLSLVIESQGLLGIADTLSDLVGYPILIEDNRYRTLCLSFHGLPNIDEKQIQFIKASSENFWINPEIVRSQKFLENAKNGIHTVSYAVEGINNSRVIAPIVVGKKLVGYASALVLGQPLNDQQLTTVEQASIIFALEFVKQEATRANLLDHIITAQEEERRRIARELHDETSQALTALMLGLDMIKMDLGVNPEKAIQRLDATKSIADGMLENIHRLISNLRPSVLDDLGLIPAIEGYCEERLKPAGISFVLERKGKEKRYSASVEIALYRIVQEALTNVIRHSNASKVTICLSFQDTYLTILVEDNGQGFDPIVLQSKDYPVKNVGLWGIQERVNILEGEFQMHTAPGKGVILEIRVPVTEELVIHG